MNLTPAEREALDSLGTPRDARTVHTIVSGLESTPDAVFLLIPVPRGRPHAIGDRITITFKESQ